MQQDVPPRLSHPVVPRNSEPIIPICPPIRPPVCPKYSHALIGSSPSMLLYDPTTPPPPNPPNPSFLFLIVLPNHRRASSSSPRDHLNHRRLGRRDEGMHDATWSNASNSTSTSRSAAAARAAATAATLTLPSPPLRPPSARYRSRCAGTRSPATSCLDYPSLPSSSS